MNTTSPSQRPALTEARLEAEEAVIKAVREIAYGMVEVVVHDHRITEIRQIRRMRIDDR